MTRKPQQPLPAGWVDGGPWWAVDIRCHEELTKAAIWRLRGPGHRVCAVDRRRDGELIWAFLESNSCPGYEIAGIHLGLVFDAEARDLPRPEMTWRLVDSWEWPEELQRGMSPRQVGERLELLSPWMEPVEPDRIPIRLDGRFGFGGVGLHPTTMLCLESLEQRLHGDNVERAPVVADIGCGAGVLCIAAVLMGAERVYAVDTKAAAVAATAANRGLNSIAAERLVVQRGSVAELRRILNGGTVDGFTCNIVTAMIHHLIPGFAEITSRGNWGVLSGIRESESSELRASLERRGWCVEAVNVREQWCSMDIVRE